MDGPGRKIPGAEALGDFDVSDLRGRLAPGDVRALIPSAESYVDLIPQEPPAGPPPWWKNAAPSVPGEAPTAAQELSAGAKWVRDNLGPSSVQWWYRENATLIPNNANLDLDVGQKYVVPQGQALGILGVTPTLYKITGVEGLATELDPFSLAFISSFRMMFSGRSSLDSEHIAPSFGASTLSRWDTSIFNRPMFWGDSSVRVPFTIYAREGETVSFALSNIAGRSFANLYTMLGTPTAAVCGYQATGVLFPMSYLF